MTKLGLLCWKNSLLREVFNFYNKFAWAWYRVGGSLSPHPFENPLKNSTLDKNMFGINLASINFRYSCFNSPVD